MAPKFERPKSPPAPLFTNTPERNFVRQINNEVIEFLLPYEILYFAVDMERTQFHELYKEAIVKAYYSPIAIKCLVDFEDQETNTTKYGIDRVTKINVHFHKRRLTEDQELFVREGDIIFYGNVHYEIVKLKEPDELFGQIEHKMAVIAECITSRIDINFNQK
jgi:hypothetical protein